MHKFATISTDVRLYLLFLRVKKMWIGNIAESIKGVFSKPAPPKKSTEELEKLEIIGTHDISRLFECLDAFTLNLVVEYIFSLLNKADISDIYQIKHGLEKIIDFSLHESYSKIINWSLIELKANQQFVAIEHLMSTISLKYPNIFMKYYTSLGTITQKSLKEYNDCAIFANINSHTGLETLCEETEYVLKKKPHNTHRYEMLSESTVYKTLISHMQQIKAQFNILNADLTTSKLFVERKLNREEQQALSITSSLIIEFIKSIKYKGDVEKTKPILEEFVKLLQAINIPLHKSSELLTIGNQFLHYAALEDRRIVIWFFQLLLPKEEINIYAIQRLLFYHNRLLEEKEIPCFAPHKEDSECRLTEETAITGYCMAEPMVKNRLEKYPEPSQLLDLLQLDSVILNVEESIIISRDKINDSSISVPDNQSFIGEDIDHQEPDIIQFENYKLISAIIALFYKNCSNSRVISGVEEQIMGNQESISLNYNKIREIITSQTQEKYRQNTTLSKLLGELNVADDPSNLSVLNETKYFSMEYNGDEFES